MNYNEKAKLSIFNTVRKSGSLNRSEIANHTGLALSTVSLQVAELLEQKLLLEEYNPNNKRKLKLSINPNKGFFIGGLVGIHRLSIQIVNLNYQAILQKQYSLENIHDPVKTNAFILKILQELILETSQVHRPILGLGLGLPFPVDFNTGRPDSPPYLPLWHDFPLIEYYEKTLCLPVLIDNDVNVMAWGEVVQRPRLDNTLFIKVGTGIGCGIVLHHNIFRGGQGCAGDIGHIAVPHHQCEIVCHCGHRGCLEAIAGSKTILAEVTKAMRQGKSSFLSELLLKLKTEQRDINLNDLSIAIQANDAFTIRLFQEKGEIIGSVISSLVNTLNPDSILLGGSVCQIGGIYLLQTIRQKVLHRAPHLATAKLNIQMTKDFIWGGSLGAAALICEHILSASMPPSTN